MRVDEERAGGQTHLAVEPSASARRAEVEPSPLASLQLERERGRAQAHRLQAGGVKRVLCVDDNPAILEDYRKVFEPAELAERASSVLDFLGESAPAPVAREFEMRFAHQGQEALALVEESLRTGKLFTVAFVDMRMPPGWNGAETIANIIRLDPGIRFVVCTAFSDVSEEELRRVAGEDLVIVHKPFSLARMKHLAHESMRRG